MSKITPPPAMTDEQIDEVVAPLYANSAAQRMGRADDIATVRAANAARDQQWQNMLVQQEPKFWLDEEDGVLFDPESERPEGCIPLFPVAQQADHFPDAGKMIPDDCVAVPRGALQMVINALRRDAAEGRTVRGEMADALLADAPVAQQAVPAGYKVVPAEALKRWRAAFAEELAAYDIDPPIHHVKASHDEIDAMLAAEQPAPVPLTDEQEREAFEVELRRQCFQKPTPGAYDLAWCMWKARAHGITKEQP